MGVQQKFVKLLEFMTEEWKYFHSVSNAFIMAALRSRCGHYMYGRP